MFIFDFHFSRLCTEKKNPFKMGDKRKLLLAVIVFTALCNKVSSISLKNIPSKPVVILCLKKKNLYPFYIQLKVTAESTRLLDLAPYAVDDLYNGCHAQALDKFIHSDLLGQELNRSKGFQKAWSSKSQCSKPIPGKIKEHLSALLAYVNGDVDFIKTFNNAVETLAVNVSTYEKQFHFKSFHFLLMESMTLLPPRECKTMYALTEEKYTAKKGSKVKLGRFTSVQSGYSELLKMYDLDGQVLLNITSCFFANLGANVCSKEDTALLSPTETFTVEDVKQITDEDGSHCPVIILKHSEVVSSHNCYIFSR